MCIYLSLTISLKSATYVKMEIPVLVRSLKSSVLSSTNFQMGKKKGVVSAAVEQSWRKAKESRLRFFT